MPEPRGVFFPWERKGGVRGLLGRTRLRMALGIAVALAAVLILRRHEEQAAAVRATRASIADAARAVMAYRADHGGACPRELAEVARAGYARAVPSDAWGRALGFRCPGRKDARDFEVWSDGPDGVPGGLDRVE